MNAAGKSTYTRAGIKDLWGAWMVRGTDWTENGNPVNPYFTTRKVRGAIPWDRALALHHRMLRPGKANYHVPAHIHFYLDDRKFDGPCSGIWANPDRLIEVARHFDGVMGIDFSTNADMPDPIKRHQVYRMRALERYVASRGIDVVQNLRWSGPETWDYFLDALRHHAPLSLGTVGSGLDLLENRPPFERGLLHAVSELEPTMLYVVGSASCPVFDEVRRMGTRVIQFDGPTAAAFKAGDLHV